MRARLPAPYTCLPLFLFLQVAIVQMQTGEYTKKDNNRYQFATPASSLIRKYCQKCVGVAPSVTSLSARF